jgi:hypothetical protein
MLPDNFDHDVEEAAGNMPAEAVRMPLLNLKQIRLSPAPEKESI